MAKENLKDEILKDEQLDEVAGGFNGLDRYAMASWIECYYGPNGERGKIIDTSSKDDTAIVSKFCTKAGIDYRQNAEAWDEYKINGEWRDTKWMIFNKEEALEFLDKKLGLK